MEKGVSNGEWIVHRFSMKRLVFGLIVVLTAGVMGQGGARNKDALLVEELKRVYLGWRAAMIEKDAHGWTKFSSKTKQIDVRNRLWSERRRFPQGVFGMPGSPPDIRRLKAMRVRVLRNTAKAIYYGKVDFGLGTPPKTNDVWVISYVREGTGWKFHGGEFVKLDVLPEVRKQLDGGDLSYFDAKDFHPNGKVERPKVVVDKPVKYIAKTYVFAPGREVRAVVNGKSDHLFQNEKRSDVILGGARDGVNELKYTIRDIPGGKPNSALTVRVYLMSQVRGVKPIKVAEYQIDEKQAAAGVKPKKSGSLRFQVTPEVVKKLMGR